MSKLAEHTQKLSGTLSALRESGVDNFIGGVSRPAAAGATFDNHSPVDESFICKVAKGDAADRKKLLHKVADCVVERADEIALAECWDTGQAYRFMSKAALRGAENFRFFADRAPGARDGQSLPSSTLLNVTTRVPIGPVGVITPWNTPFMLSTWKIAPALAAGCTVVHKPAEFSPVTARILAEIANEAGIPPGVWNLVNGYGEEAGKALCENPDVKAIAFVGESKTGSAIMKQGADTLKRVHFELGGKNPVVVFDDAELDRALDAAIFMIYSLNGERCTSSSRLLIQDSVADEFLDKLAARVEKIKVGNPLDPDTEIGPLIHQVHATTLSQRSLPTQRTACVSHRKKFLVQCSRQFDSRPKKRLSRSLTIFSTASPVTSGPII